MILRGTVANVRKHGYALITEEEYDLVAAKLEERGFRALDAGEWDGVDCVEICEDAS